MTLRKPAGTNYQYRDLRDWVKMVADFGELRVLKGADWNLEIGAITEVFQRPRHWADQPRPCFLFDEIKDYPAGFRVLSGILSSPRRLALTMGLEEIVTERLELIKLVREKLKQAGTILPRFVKKGPILENIDAGDKVDLTKFPVPIWHEEDCGRYIGTGSITITRDPDEGWVNIGTYRVMLHDEKTVGFYISPGKHGRIHRDKYFEKGEPCPVVVSIGHDPLLLLLGTKEVDYRVSEFEVAGGIKNKAIDVIKGVSGLPIPADAELVLEGEAVPGELRQEGPFGEWTGYYGSSSRPEPVIRVKRVLYRDNPIILGAPPSKPPNENSFPGSIVRAAMIWNELEKTGIPDITGVYSHEAGGHRLFIVIAIRQRYSGHARQAALALSQCHSAAYMGRFVVVVDDDIDITSLDDVVWAMCTRCDPEYGIDILRRCWSGPLDPIIPEERRGFSSRAIVDACKPYERIKTFPKAVQVSDKLRDFVVNKWYDRVKDTGKPSGRKRAGRGVESI
jgi:UbiD family decarboxylase